LHRREIAPFRDAKFIREEPAVKRLDVIELDLDVNAFGFDQAGNQSEEGEGVVWAG
jgi:hypothetical protein